MTKPLVLIGGGGHAVVVCEAARLSGHDIVGVLDDAPSPHVCQGDDQPGRLGPLQDQSYLNDRSWILCMGDLDVRREMHDVLLDRMDNAGTVIHPTAFVSPSAELGRGVYVGPGAVVHSRAYVADHAIVNTGAVIEHDCRVGTGSHIAPNATLGGGALVGAYALVGLVSTVLPHITVGSGAVVGAGSVVTKPVDDNAQVIGSPAKVQA
ncbi:MAG: acetyltransferase [Planctomycetota bacterium]